MTSLEEAVAELIVSRYLLLRPNIRGGGDTWRAIQAEDALHRAFLGDDAEGVPDQLLLAAAARKAGLPLIAKDADALDLHGRAGRPSLPLEPVDGAPEPSGGSQSRTGATRRRRGLEVAQESAARERRRLFD